MPIVRVRTIIDVEGNDTVNPAALPDTIASVITESVSEIPGVVGVTVNELVREEPEVTPNEA